MVINFIGNHFLCKFVHNPKFLRAFHRQDPDTLFFSDRKSSNGSIHFGLDFSQTTVINMVAGKEIDFIHKLLVFFNLFERNPQFLETWSDLIVPLSFFTFNKIRQRYLCIMPSWHIVTSSRSIRIYYVKV